MWTWILSVGGAGLWSVVVWLVSSHRVSHRMQAVLDQTRQRADLAEGKVESLDQSRQSAQARMEDLNSRLSNEGQAKISRKDRQNIGLEGL